MTRAELAALQGQADLAGKRCCVGALIKNLQGQVFVQKRSAERRLFPNGWDIVGGHVELGETLEKALTREITEETGWLLTHIDALLGVHEWEAEGQERLEFDFLVSVSGDLAKPLLEKGKASEYRWLGLGELEVLKENRPLDDLAIFHLIQHALSFTPHTLADPKND